ncbi:immunity protein Imm33 domain-containing protein [Undibacterium umbellatum]|uniref:Imm33-like domain-containing protein n=1 Tax=Undibacterium umbellatum TaxID=2762300 RepID=A0ABR6Z7X3_9BURK|nr:hypothetical protein [Undibacterium umbellatum]MBC3907878.1 hypothetical protein [Undibacterium umbellatum]
MVLINSAKIGGTLIKVACESELDLQAKWLLGVLEQMYQRGVKFDDGTRIQIGWSILSLIKQDDGSFMVCEPDFDRNPFEDIRNSVDVSLNVIAKQNKFTSGIGAKQVPIAFQNKVIMAKGVLDESSFYLERIAPDLEKNDSGWYIGKTNLNEEKDELSAIYAFQLLQLRPELIDVLTLPEGYMVFVDGLTVSCVTNPNDEVVFS